MISASIPRTIAPRAASTMALALWSVLSACNSSSGPSGDGGSSGRWAAAVGAAGTFAQTFDDVSWSSRSIAPGDLYAVACVGNQYGWASGAGGTIAHTTDGGQTWVMQDAHTSTTLRAVRFATQQTGVVAGDAGLLAVTSDGGSTWRTVPLQTTAALRGIAVAAAAGLMVVVGDGATVLRSTDDGATWNAEPIAGAGDLRAVASDAEAHLVIAVDASGGVWSSSDGGLHFGLEVTAAGSLDAVAVSDDGALAVVAGAHGLVMERAGGAAWRVAPTSTTADLHAAVITGSQDNLVYVAGESGTLLGSPDRGATWAPRASATRAALYSLDDL